MSADKLIAFNLRDLAELDPSLTIGEVMRLRLAPGRVFHAPPTDETVEPVEWIGFTDDCARTVDRPRQVQGRVRHLG